ncbi:MAG TPA: hypothetical protein DDY14_14280 [Chromatiaceae bacterium]|jgi:hypothetical protein|nr:MAG: hypothetical protein N838_10160 [Thiohalocapsa sp. PB-PSB1]HBG96447.1 hypothetical protein [Chromatiaceae bacterium]HCS92315.1 hypothetical protein [Chromatiaceae bacterium]
MQSDRSGKNKPWFLRKRYDQKHAKKTIVLKWIRFAGGERFGILLLRGPAALDQAVWTAVQRHLAIASMLAFVLPLPVWPIGAVQLAWA